MFFLESCNVKALSFESWLCILYYYEYSITVESCLSGFFHSRLVHGIVEALEALNTVVETVDIGNKSLLLWSLTVNKILNDILCCELLFFGWLFREGAGCDKVLGCCFQAWDKPELARRGDSRDSDIL
jgi:hypothetical protein